ncbi:MAG TPA: undecaprenyl-diphosphate phosphatase [Flavobacterium sp.]|nr:undecaprenyl-diphosphate phosphatase [Flavobacterium sp.]
MNIIQAIILGAVEGVTEFLPISSTGHLILTSKLLSLHSTEFLKSFEIIVQLGAILAVVFLYWRTFLTNWAVLKRVVVAFIPTAIIGLVFYKIVKNYLLGNEQIVLWSLFIGGILLIIFEIFHSEKDTALDDLANLSYGKAALIGIFQSLAIIPGVSRSAATILGGLLLDMRRKAIVEFSFLLAVPTMIGATGLDLFKSADQFSSDQFGVLAIGFVTAFITALISIKFLLNYIQKRNFMPFGIYRIALAILFWLVII